MSIRPLFAAATIPMLAHAPDARLQALHQEHGDLDAAIAALSLSGNADDLTVTRLKKRKLHLKDEIAALMASAFGDGVAKAS
jgi:hypothetical protein